MLPCSAGLDFFASLSLFSFVAGGFHCPICNKRDLLFFFFAPPRDMGLAGQPASTPSTGGHISHEVLMEGMYFAKSTPIL
jgi:hypothetical protein